MSNVTEIIERWDKERVGHDVEFHYVTPEMDESKDARKHFVTSDELCQFIEENGLNEFQSDVDQFIEYDAFDFLMDNWEEVTDQYWDEIAQPTLETNYKEACAYIQSFIQKAGHPLTDAEVKTMHSRVVQLFGITFGKEAA